MRIVLKSCIRFCFLFLAAAMSAVPGFLAGEDRRLNDDAGTADQLDPSSAMSRYGAAVFVWVDARGGAPNIFGYRATPKGMPAGTGANFRVTSPGWSGFQFNPDVALDDLGRFVVVWDEKGMGGQDIYGRRFAANGTPIGDAFEIAGEPDAGETLSNACVAMDSSGNFAVCWNWKSGHQSDIYMRRYDAAGTALGPASRINAQLTGYSENPAVGMNRSGWFVVAWEDNLTGQTDIIAQRFDSNGFLVGGNFEASNMPGQTNPAQDPAVDVLEEYNDRQGWFCVAFSCRGPGDRASDIHGYFFKGEAGSRTITISDSTLGAEDRYPDVAAVYMRGYMTAWQSGDGSDIYRCYVGGNGPIPSIYIPERVNQPAGTQEFPCVSWGNESTLFAWSDNRNSHSDIYAQWEGDRCPTFVYAGSGFDGMVPLAWDHAYGDDQTVPYKISRFETTPDSLDMMTQTGHYPQLEDYDLVATVDPADRGYPKLMLDWIDRNVVQGRVYHYMVQADIVDDHLDLTAARSFSVPSAGFRIHSNWTEAAPVIDGFLDLGEWMQATEVTISNPDAIEPVTLFVMNDDSALYIAAKDLNDNIPDLMNALSFLIDRDHSGSWDPASPSDEGAYQVISAATGFTGYYGDYPGGFRHMGIVLSPADLTGAVSVTSGHVQYEARLDIPAPPGSTIGFAASVNDPGVYYRRGFPYAGMWPPAALWDAAETLGDLVLADQSSETGGDWLMINQGPQRRSWAAAEDELVPPFSGIGKWTVEDSLYAGQLVFKDELLFAGICSPYGVISGMGAFNAAGGTEPWYFEIPATYKQVPFYPVLNGSDLFCGTKRGSDIHVLDQGSGEIRRTQDLWCDRMITDGSRLYSSLRHTIYCSDATDGEGLWTFEVPEDPVLGRPYLPEFAFDGSVLYVCNGADLYGLNAQTGALLWQTENTGYPFLAVDEDFIYTQHENAFVARRKSDRGVAWSYPVQNKEFFYFDGTGIAVSDLHLCFACADTATRRGELNCLDKTEGNLLWQQSFDTTLVFPPVIANGVVYASGWGNRGDETYEYWIKGFHAGSGEELFSDDSEPYFGQPIVAGHALFAPAKGGVKIFANGPVHVASPASGQVPSEFGLEQNYPDPFNPSTTIRFSVREPGPVTLKVYDVLGTEVAELADRRFDAGTHELVFDATGLPSGIYLIRMKTDRFSVSRKIVKVE